MGCLPQCERAILDVRKLEDYCLSPDHHRGRHKARRFRDTLGIARADAIWLSETLLVGIQDADAIELATDRFGVRWRADVSVERFGKRATVRTIWIVRTGDDLPRFVSCWVLG